MFDGREDAGKKLGEALAKYAGKGAIVLAIPRGGVEVGCQVARRLKADFSIIVARKLPLPEDPEAGFGAIAEDGSTYIVQHAAAWVGEEEIERIKEEQKREIRRRIKILRRGRPLPDLKGRTVILVDDGIAMGSTMRASIALARKKGAGRVVVAVPVTGPETAEEISALADEIVVLEVPRFFRAVAQVYRNWYDVSDEEVLDLLARCERNKDWS